MSIYIHLNNNFFYTNNKSMKKSAKFLLVTLSLGAVILALFVFSQFTFGLGMFNNNKFYNGTTINGVDVSGMTIDEVSNMVATKLISSRGDVKLTLKYKDKTWQWTGENFEPNNEIIPAVKEVFAEGRKGNFFERRNAIKQIKNNGLEVNIPYTYVLGGIDEKLNAVAEEINSSAQDAVVHFDPSSKEIFVYEEEKIGVRVDEEKLKSEIDNALISNPQAVIDIPVFEDLPAITVEDLKKDIALRGTFETSIASSKSGRKHNVKRALGSFNGMIVEPSQEVSFNAVTGSRTVENGYEKANIILNGVYVEGTGGGVCQASTTLYNALILSDLEILEVNPHSLPASYVPLAFDAMVSEGYSDLIFKNNTDKPIYIRTFSDDKKVVAEIYGKPFEEGLTIVTKADFVGVLNHPGDRIVKDTEKQYADKVTYEGEYLRLKYPQEGYHSKAYLQYYKNGELVEEKLIRDEIYKAQEGIIIEGTEKLIEGMTLPENNVRFIPPQTSSSTSEDSVKNKLEKQNPSDLNP